MPFPASNRKQLLLYLGAVILPGALLVAFALRTARQERALESRASADARRHAAGEIARELILSLEELRLRSMSGGDTGGGAFPRPLRVIHASGLRGRPDGAPRLRAGTAAELREAERAEFRGELLRALTLYQRLIDTSGDPLPQGYARLGLARTLVRSGRANDATEHYLALLSLPFDVTDEEGMPIALYAADRLAKVPEYRDSVARVLVAAMISRPVASLLESYMVREVAASIADSAGDALVADAGAHVARAEQYAALKKDLPALLRLHGGRRADSQGFETTWFPFGDPLWLVSARATEGGDTIVFIADPTQLERIIARRLSNVTAGPVQLLAESEDGGGESLAPFLPGLRAAFELPRQYVSRRAAFGAPLLLLVILLAAFAAALLWWDVQRESRTASQRARFASAVSHELKTPLTSIRMYAELIRMYPADALRRQEYLDTIIGESERLTRLIDNVLHVSRTDRVSRRYRLEEGRMQDVVRAAADAMAYPMSREGVTLRLDVDDRVPGLSVDRDAMTNAVLNLLSNAVKFSPGGGEVEMKLERSNGHVVLSVRDQGVGIPPEDQGRVFEEFYRSPDADARGIGGTGLGLSLVEDVVRAHHGSIDLKSTPGQGTTFAIRLPMGNGA